LHIEELKSFVHLANYLGDQVRECGMNGEKINVYWVQVGKPEGKRSLERCRCRLNDNIKLDLKEVGLGEWIGFIWLRIGTRGRPL
jgi:hypothetical protein